MKKRAKKPAKKSVVVVDILGMELRDNAPHWLSQKPEKDPAEGERRKQEIRDRHRRKYLDNKQKERGLARSSNTDYISGASARSFEESEHPRDPGGEGGGQFVSKGGGSGGSGQGEGGGSGQGDRKPQSNGKGNAGVGAKDLPQAYKGQSSGDDKSSGLTEFSPTDQGKADLEAVKATPVDFVEHGKGGGQSFQDAIKAAKDSSEFGAAVTVYPAEKYENVRTFTSKDNSVGFALDGDDIVSVFKHADSPVKNATASILKLATEQGGRRLDCFDTQLPGLYSRAGFRAVARLPFDPDYKPDDWSYEKFGAFNNGKPDVIFMVYDPDNAKPYQAGDGDPVSSYDDGIAAQRKALEKKAAD